MFISTLHYPCVTANILDAGLFSQTLSKLATDGLGVSALQVINERKNELNIITVFQQECKNLKPQQPVHDVS